MRSKKLGARVKLVTEIHDLPLVMTISDIALTLQVHKVTVSRWIRTGVLPIRNYPKVMLRDDFIRWVKSDQPKNDEGDGK